jgi:type 1 glutamine amidotransferase
MRKYPLLLLVLGLGIWLVAQADENPKADAPKPLRILLIAGGCCHDYAAQKDVLKAGIESRIRAEVDIEYNPSKGTDTTFPKYDSDDWAKGYDVILHDECSASVDNKDYVKRILDAHRTGTPAVNIHCAMHSYRWGDFRKPVKPGDDNAGWYEMIGIQSTGHGPKLPIDVTFTDTKHPITVGMKDWQTGKEELYNNVQVFDSAHALATGRQVKKGKDPDAKPTEAKAVVAWTNTYGPKKTRIFNTTLGHFTETVADDRYLDLVTRGLLWVTDHLGEDGNATGGYGEE